MTKEKLGVVLRCIRAFADGRGAADCTDASLLDRFTAFQEEDAFAALMHRHGPMVLGVCRRTAGHVQDAEDAFQATFLLLARKAGAIRRRESVASWLHGVAHRVALKARIAVVRRQQREKQAATRRMTAGASAAWHELQAELDEALERLPDKYRSALVLCCFEGRTVEEAARALGCPRGTVASRLAQGRELLRRRLTRRGLVLSTGALTTSLLAGTASAGVTPALWHTTLQAGMQYAAGKAVAGVASPAVAALVSAGLRSMFFIKGKAVLLALVLCGLLGTAGVFAQHGPGQEPPIPTHAVEPVSKATEEKPAIDSAGDRLPEGALARLGTLRFRSPSHVVFLALTPDSRQVISQASDGIRIWETGTGKELRHIPEAVGSSHGFSNTTTDLSPNGKLLAVADTKTKNVGLWDIATGKQVRTLAPDRSHSLVRFSPSGKSLLTDGNDSTLQLWDVDTGKMLRSWQAHKGGVSSADFSRDGKTMVSSGSDQTFRLWDVATGKQTEQIAIGSISVGRIVVSPDCKLIASIGQNVTGERLGAQGGSFSITPENFIRIWDVASGKEVRRLVAPKVKDAGESSGFGEFVFAPDGKTLVTTGQSVLRIWDPATGKEMRQIPLDCYASWGLAFSGDGKMLTTAAGGLTIRLFDPESGKDLAPFGGQQLSVGELALSATGRSLAVSSYGDTIEVWDPVTGRLRRRLKGHKKPITSLRLAGDGRTLFSTGQDKTVCVWDLETGVKLRRFKVEVAANWESVAVSPDGTTMAWTKEKSVLILDSKTGKKIKEFSGLEPWSLGAAFFEGGKKLATWSVDHKMHLWDLSAGRKLLQFPFPKDRGPPRPGVSADQLLAYLIAISPDGRLVAYGSQEKYLVFMELATGREIACFTNLPDGPCPLAFSPDGRTLAWGGWQDTAVRLMEAATGKERRRMLGHKGRVVSLVYSGDGNMLISGSMDTTALVWDLAIRRKGGKDSPLSQQELDTCWADLAADDAARAYQAIRKLAGDPVRSVPFLEKRLRPVPPVQDKHLARLIADLDSKEFTVRQQATKELEKLAEIAIPACRKKLEGDASIEVRRRLERLLEKEKQQWQNPPNDVLQVLRAMETLELAGNLEARKTLSRMSQGASQARLTQDAKAALARMVRPPS